VTDQNETLLYNNKFLLWRHFRVTDQNETPIYNMVRGRTEKVGQVMFIIMVGHFGGYFGFYSNSPLFFLSNNWSINVYPKILLQFVKTPRYIGVCY